MLYFLAEYFAKLEFLRSIYLRTFLAFVISFCIVLFAGKPFIKYLKVKKFGEEIMDLVHIFQKKVLQLWVEF